MDITAYIIELLFGHDCVIVPGFGGFLGNYTPAYIDKNSGTFYPPVKQISFNRNLNHNDGLLVGKISGSTTVNYGDARTIVEEFVRELQRKLEKGEKIVFENIGSFINNREGNVQFEPDLSVNYHLDSYGLESFQLHPLEGYDVRKRIGKHINRDPLKQASIRKILWRAAIIIPLLTVVVTVPLKTDLFKTKVETTSLNPLISAEFEHNKIAVDESVTETPAETNEITQPVSSEPKEPAEIAPVVTETASYYLITGSFKSEDNAVNQANLLKAEGFVPEIVSAPNGFFRVSAMTFSDLHSAVVKKDSISKKFPGTWISGKK